MQLCQWNKIAQRGKKKKKKWRRVGTMTGVIRKSDGFCNMLTAKKIKENLFVSECVSEVKF